MSRESIFGVLIGLVLATAAFGQTTWNGRDCLHSSSEASRDRTSDTAELRYAGRIGLSNLPPREVGREGRDGRPLEFGTVSAGQTATRMLEISNDSKKPLRIAKAVLYGSGASNYALNFRSESMPITLAPGESTALELIFQPQSMGAQSARISVIHSGVPRGHMGPTLALYGVGLGEPGSELLINCGGTPRMDSRGQIWSGDLGASGGRLHRPEQPLIGAGDDELFETLRVGRQFSYAFDLPNGDYDVTVYFAEGQSTSGGRAIDITLEGEQMLSDRKGNHKGHGRDQTDIGGLADSAILPVTVVDGTLNLVATTLLPGSWVGVAGIEVRSGFRAVPTPLLSILNIDPASLDFGFLIPGGSADLPLVLKNSSQRALNLATVGFLVGPAGGSGPEFTLDLGGVMYPGLSDNGVSPASLILRPGQSTTATVTFAPSLFQINDMVLQFKGNFKTVNVPILAAGGVDTTPFLHTVIEDPGTVVDFDGDNVEMVTLDGTFSHTHNPGGSLIDFIWKDGATVIGTGITINVPLSVGVHPICLTIGDDSTPQGTLTACETINVVPPSEVPGALVLYHRSAGLTILQMLTMIPNNPMFAEERESMEVIEESGNIGSSPLSGNVMVRVLASFSVPSAGPYEFSWVGGTAGLLRLNGSPLITTQGQVVQLAAGEHDIEARFAVTDLNDLPLNVLMAPLGSTLVPIPSSNLFHDLTAVRPVINSWPLNGGVAGGDPITITGLGFFPTDQVTVSWGLLTLTDVDFTSITPSSISFLSPPNSAGPVRVSVQTPQGSSNEVEFLYKALFVPVDFTTLFTSANVPQATSGDWGPDGRFYVTLNTGEVKAITFDQDYNVLSEVSYDGVSNLTNFAVLGVCFNPYDPPSPVKVYVAHSELYAQGGGSFTGPSPYSGQVSVLTGPNFDTPVPLITGLPTSNHDHAVNGMQFDHNGDLLICVGSNTNAGVKAPLSGDVPESPLSGAILKAETSRPDFSGTITYVETISGLPNDDQVFGEEVDVAPGSHVTVQGHGIRNPYDLVYTLDGRLYATNNGPNSGFGAASTGPNTEIGDPTEPDRLELIEYDNFYGHANRSRGRTDPRQDIYRSVTLPAVPGEYSAPLEVLSSSTNGICEYRATTFGGQMRGELLAQRWWGQVRRFEMAPDGRSVSLSADLSNLISLDVEVGPGGVILGIDYSGGRVKVMIPNDAGAIGLTTYDIFPNRAPSTGGQPFVIGGAGFGSIGNTSVLIDGIPATLTSVTSQRIHGLLPMQPTPTTDLVDVQVTVDASVSTITEGFRYLFPMPGMEPGRWETLPSLPIAMGEVAVGIIDGVIYLVGEGSHGTFAYDIRTKTWDDTLPERPFAGHHQAAEVIDGKLYLVGGIDHFSEGTVQIYDPVLEIWSMGATMPWNAGSVSSCVIDGKIYAAGGIVGSSTVTDCGVYDPVLDSWTTLTSMPLGRNHAASISDGTRFWIFGGRTGGNTVTNGFDDIQVYDPMTDTWEWDKDGVSALVPMPQHRGGTGKSVFYRGEFYVMGGETVSGGGSVAGNVYDRVDVYDPTTNTWRLDATMPTPRHGIYPVLYQSRMFLPGGGVVAANSQSTVVDVFTRQ